MNNTINIKRNNPVPAFDTLLNNHKLDTHDNKVSNSSPSFNLQKNFLTLLIAQIQNQDPIDPIKNTELTSQLAQINTVGQMEKLNNTVGKLKYESHQKQKIAISSLIGHHVMIPNNQLIHNQKQTTNFGIEFMDNTTLAKIKIQDDEGKIVFLKNVENIQPGLYHFSWNGKNLDNQDVNTGKYSISVEAKNQNENVTTNILRESIVNSVITNSPHVSNFIIDLGVHGTTTLSNVHEILT